MGLLSIDMLELEIKAQIGTEEEKKSVSLLPHIRANLLFIGGQDHYSFKQASLAFGDIVVL